MRKEIILVGASGRVGRLVAAGWRKDHLNSLRFLRQVRGERAETTANQLNWDPLSGSAQLCDWVESHGTIRTMVVLAGATPRSGHDLSLNSTIAESCLAAAKDAQITRVLIASTSAVYGLGDGSPFRETDHCNPANAYGEAKLAMERLCSGWSKNDLEVCCLRIGNVAGADALLLNLINAEPSIELDIDIFPNGNGPIRSYIGPGSLGIALKTLASTPKSLPSVVNVAAPEPIAMEQLAECAGQSWKAREVADASHQSITLDCSLLAGLHSFSSADSDPEEMIRQWKDAIEYDDF